jgi:hypothetical protein
MEVVFGGREHVEAGVVGEHGELAHLVEHSLVPLGVAADRPEGLALVKGSGDGRQDEEHELHAAPPGRSDVADDRTLRTRRWRNSTGRSSRLSSDLRRPG